MSRIFNNVRSPRRRRLRVEPLEQRALLTVDMTPFEQLFIELVNRSRADPVAEIERIAEIERRDGKDPLVTDLNQDVSSDKTISVDPKQPLAPHQALTDAMGAHVTDMLRRNYFAHGSPEGSNPSTRAMGAGYPDGAAENIAWAGYTHGLDELQEVYDRHIGLVQSVGHRINMMQERWREIGAGIDFGLYTDDNINYQSIMAGTLFGRRAGDYFITGVAITDRVVPNNFYEVGEGIGGITITAIRDGTDETYVDVTGSSGGYGLRVPDGTYTVTATGTRLLQPITVRGVVVDGENVKIDFNTSQMPTRSINGQFFDDANGNGVRDGNELGAAGRIAFVDLDEDGSLDAAEPRVESGPGGIYTIDGLLPGDYTVRQVVPSGLTETLPLGTYVIPLSSRNIVGVDFATRGANEPPTAVDDAVRGEMNQSITIAALQNDSDVDGGLAFATVRVESGASRGSVAVNDNYEFVYVPDAGFAGVDHFTYSVADSSGVRSNVATVEVSVVSSRPWQNSARPLDVDNDGFVVARDVLFIIRELNINGPHSLSQSRLGNEPYLDVSGDNFLSSLDALRIIRHLNMHVGGSGEPPGEVVLDAADLVLARISDSSEEDGALIPIPL